MAGLGIGIAWLGYWVLYYGVTQVQSGNWGFLDLGIPSRWANAAATPKDDGSVLGLGSGGTAVLGPASIKYLASGGQIPPTGT
jgi:hypothetical protein